MVKPILELRISCPPLAPAPSPTRLPAKPARTLPVFMPLLFGSGTAISALRASCTPTFNQLHCVPDCQFPTYRTVLILR
jgi:hypothetical protein